jgi:hypothetical protein
MLQNMQVAHESDIRDNGSYAIGTKGARGLVMCQIV